MNHRQAIYGLVTASSVIALFPSHSYAQSTPERPADEVASFSEDIIVTATRRSEALNKVPLSITAFSEADMERKVLNSASDLFAQTPGLTFTPNGLAGSSAISIRGVSANTGAGTVGIYIDDTPIQVRSNAVSAATNFYPQLVDLQRVEVLRGPQGTLFGAGSQGGAIRFITGEPDTREFSVYSRGEFAMTQGGGPTFGVAGNVNIPLIQDKLAVSAQAAFRRSGGWVDQVNETGFVTSKNYNWRDETSARVAIKYRLTDNLEIMPSFFFQDSYSHGNNLYWPTLSDPSKGKFISADKVRESYDGQFYLPALKIRWSLGNIELFSNTSYFSSNDRLGTDYGDLIPALSGLTTTQVGSAIWITETTPTVLPTTGNRIIPDYFNETIFTNKHTAFIQEVRVQSSGSGPLNWVLGFFYNDIMERSLELVVDPPAQWNQVLAHIPPARLAVYGGIPLSRGIYSYDTTNTSKEKQTAFFGEATWEIVSGLKLTAGLRYQITDFSFVQNGAGPFNGGVTTGGGEQKEKPLTPKFNISYQIDNANMIYFSASKGFRNGGANYPLPAACDASLNDFGLGTGGYGADTVWSYEVGAKNRFFGNRLATNSSIYQIDWNDIQRSVPLPSCALNTTANLGSARIRGGDVQVEALLTDNFSISASVAYTDAVFAETITGAPGAGGVRPIIARKGVSIGARPWQVVAGAQYRFDVSDMPGFIRADYQYNGRAPITSVLDPLSSSYNDRAVRLPSYDNLDMSAGLKMGNVDVSLYIKNVLNSTPLTQASRGLFRSRNLVIYDATLQPRTIGLQVTFRR